MNNRKSNNNKKKAFSIIILLLLILISVVAVAFKFFGNSKSGIEIDGNAKDYVSEAKLPEDYRIVKEMLEERGVCLCTK